VLIAEMRGNDNGTVAGQRCSPSRLRAEYRTPPCNGRMSFGCRTLGRTRAENASKIDSRPAISGVWRSRGTKVPRLRSLTNPVGRVRTKTRHSRESGYVEARGISPTARMIILYGGFRSLMATMTLKVEDSTGQVRRRAKAAPSTGRPDMSVLSCPGCGAGSCRLASVNDISERPVPLSLRGSRQTERV